MTPPPPPRFRGGAQLKANQIAKYKKRFVIQKAGFLTSEKIPIWNLDKRLVGVIIVVGALCSLEKLLHK